MSPDSAFYSSLQGTPGSLSVCMIVKNEAGNITRCLDSVREAADDIVVVDTGSTDDTVALARKCGARVIETEWHDNFSEARNISIDHAKGRWILWFDGDDVLRKESVPLLNELKQAPADSVLSFTVVNQKWGNTGTEFVQARMFPNHPGIRFERRIHEQVTLSALRLGLGMQPRPVVIEHYGYANMEIMRVKARRNIALLLQEYDTRNPDSVMAVELADSYALIEDLDNALRWYRAVLDIPDTVSRYPVIASHAHLGIGNILNRREMYDKAARELWESLSLIPDRPDALFGLAVSFDMSGKYEKAVEVLKRILVIKDRPLEVGIDFRQARIKAFLRLERILRERGRMDEAWDAAEKAVQAAPERPEIHNTLGAMFFRAGKLVEAIHAFEKSLDIIIDGNIDAYIGLCHIYKKAGRHELVGTTVQTMESLFSARPRFWAARSILCENGTTSRKLPEGMDAETVEKEIDIIRNMFAIR